MSFEGDQVRALDPRSLKTDVLDDAEGRLLRRMEDWRDERDLSRADDAKAFQQLVRMELVEQRIAEEPDAFHGWTAVEIAAHQLGAVNSGRRVALTPLPNPPLVFESPSPPLNDVSLAAALSLRHSTRQFSAIPLDFGDLGRLLWAALAPRWRFDEEAVARAAPANPAFDEGSNLGKVSSPYPVAGASNVHTLYLVVGRVVGLAEGIYRYDAAGHALDALGSAPWLGMARLFFDGPDWVDDAPLVALLASRPMDRPKYRHAYKLALLEAGHILQNLQLCACAVGWSGCEIGALDHQALTDTLSLAERFETPVAAIALGLPVEERA